jgi:dihydroorotase
MASPEDRTCHGQSHKLVTKEAGMNRFTMRKPDDFHLHLRSGEMLRAVLPHTARQFKRAIIMPNTTPPILNDGDVRKYRQEIISAPGSLGFKPLMTIQIIEATTPETIFKAKAAGAVAGKVYPRGMTTNSANGVYDYEKIYHPILAAMEECGMLVLFHGESPDPDAFCLDRETKFLKILKGVANTFTRLKIVMEHVTTAEAVVCVRDLPANVAATITVHHLFLTLNDVIGDKLEPHHFCKPVAKRPEDRERLRLAAMIGNPKFFLGTDSAPHLRGAKECSSGCAGVYTAPVAIPLLLELFEQHGVADKLEDFCSGFGADFYGLPRNKETISLIREEWTIPPICDGVVPFRAGQKIGWRME